VDPPHAGKFVSCMFIKIPALPTVGLGTKNEMSTATKLLIKSLKSIFLVLVVKNQDAR
jgi:hypothetical protein